MPDYATYGGWIRRGRQVRKNERAEVYALEPDGTRRVALFADHQTDLFDEEDVSDWQTVLAADLPPKDARRKLSVDVKDGRVRVWCGPDKDVIALLQRRKWTFDAKSTRWIADHGDVQLVIKTFQERGYNVQLEAEI